MSCDFSFGVFHISIGLIICENPQTLSPQMQECVKIPISLSLSFFSELI